MTWRNVTGWVFIVIGASSIALARWKTRHMVEWDALVAMWYGYLCGCVLMLGGIKMASERGSKYRSGPE